MTRLLLLAAGSLAALVALLWASARDLRQPWTVIPTPDPEDDMAAVQVDVRPLTLKLTTRYWPDGSWRYEEYDPTRTYSTSDEWPRPFPTLQTGPLGPAA